MFDRLKHRTVFKDADKIACSLPLTSIPFYDGDSEAVFHLTEDPQITQKAAIVGMFVLRPAMECFSDGNIVESMYERKLSWSYNFDGLDGNPV
jgi:hypothetical protein